MHIVMQIGSGQSAVYNIKGFEWLVQKTMWMGLCRFTEDGFEWRKIKEQGWVGGINKKKLRYKIPEFR